MMEASTVNKKEMSHMLRVYFIIIVILFFLLTIMSGAFGAVGDPTKFLNASGNVTAQIGGNAGIGNFTGNVYASQLYGNLNASYIQNAPWITAIPYQSSAAGWVNGTANTTSLLTIYSKGNLTLDNAEIHFINTAGGVSDRKFITGDGFGTHIYSVDNDNLGDGINFHRVDGTLMVLFRNNDSSSWFYGEMTANRSINVIGNVTSSNLFGNLSWSYLNNYPAACSAGYGISALNDSVTCTQFLTSYTETDPVFSAQNSTIYSRIAEANNTATRANTTATQANITATQANNTANAKAGTGAIACGDGYYPVNITLNTSGIYANCIADEVGEPGAGDISAVYTTAPYLTGGQSGGDVTLVFNESKLNVTIDARAATGNPFNQVLNTTSNVTFNRLNFSTLLSSADTSAGCTNRPLVSTGEQTIEVHTTESVQDVICENLPYFLLHRLTINIDGDYTLMENITVPPYIGQHSDDYTGGQLRIRSVWEEKAKLGGIFVSGVIGQANPYFEGLNITGYHPYYSGKCQICLFGVQQAEMYAMTFSGTTAVYGLTSYGSNVKIANSNFEGQPQYALETKQAGTILASNITGSVTKEPFFASQGPIYIDGGIQSTITPGAGYQRTYNLIGPIYEQRSTSYGDLTLWEVTSMPHLWNIGENMTNTTIRGPLYIRQTAGTTVLTNGSVNTSNFYGYLNASYIQNAPWITTSTGDGTGGWTNTSSNTSTALDIILLNNKSFYSAKTLKFIGTENNTEWNFTSPLSVSTATLNVKSADGGLMQIQSGTSGETKLTFGANRIQPAGGYWGFYDGSTYGFLVQSTGSVNRFLVNSTVTRVFQNLLVDGNTSLQFVSATIVNATTFNGNINASYIQNVPSTWTTDTDTWNTTEQMRAAVNNSGIYNISINASNVLNPPWATSTGNPFNQVLNTTSNVTFNNVTTQQILFINSTGSVTDALRLYSGTGGIIEASVAFRVNNLLTGVLGIQSLSDIYSTGAGDDFWLGNAVQASALFRAYATGEIDGYNLTVTNGLFGTLNASYIQNAPWITSTQVPTYETDAAHDSCSEISGCVVGAITDGNTNWDNSYGFINSSNITAGQGITLTGLLINHTDTSTQATSDNTGRVYIQDITLDTFGHITAIATATETVTDTDTKMGTDGIYLYNTSTIHYFNETKLNSTIQALSDIDTKMGTSGPYLYNDSTLHYFNETKLNATIDARDDVGTDGTGGWTNDSISTNTSLKVYIKANQIGAFRLGNTTSSLVTGFELAQFDDDDGLQSDWTYRMANDGWSEMNLASHSGSLASPTLSHTGSDIGAINFLSYNGSNWSDVATISATKVLTQTESSLPARLEFYTTPTGTKTKQLVMIILENGIVNANYGINTTNVNATNFYGNLNASYIQNVPVAWTTDTDDQTCAEVSGCVVGAITAVPYQSTAAGWTNTSSLTSTQLRTEIKTSSDILLLTVNNSFSGTTGTEVMAIYGTTGNSISNGKAFSVGNGTSVFQQGMFYTNGMYGIGSGTATRDIYLSRQSANKFLISSDGVSGVGHLNVTGDIDARNITLSSDLYIGTNDVDSHINFFEDGSNTGETIYWQNSGDLFYITDSTYIEGTATVAALSSTGDIYTTGADDDFWLGTSTQSSATVQINATGNAKFQNVSVNCITFISGGQICGG